MTPRPQPVPRIPRRRVQPPPILLLRRIRVRPPVVTLLLQDKDPPESLPLDKIRVTLWSNPPQGDAANGKLLY
jgi:hypothetical protein